MDLFSYLLGKKAGSKGATKVIANPELAGTEDNLTGLQVGDEKYKVSEVNANPTLAGTEAELEGIEVDGIKYKIPESNDYIFIWNGGNDKSVSVSGNWYLFGVGLSSVAKIKGESFSRTEDGYIKVGKNVSRIKFSITFAVKGTTQETAPSLQFKTTSMNNWANAIPVGNVNPPLATSYVTSTIVGIKDVQEDELLRLGGNTAGTGTLTFSGYGTTVLVEKIE